MKFPTFSRLIFSLMILSSTPAYADRDITDQQNAARIAKEGKPGRVLKIKKVELPNRSAYKVKVLRPNGDVKTILVDPESKTVIRKRKKK